MMKTDSKGDAQKEKIVRIAREIFATNGFEATTTRKINQEAGIAEGLMYYYFPHGKRQILDTVVYEGVMARLSTAKFSFRNINSSADLEDQLMACFEKIWANFSDEQLYQSFMITIRERPLLSDKQANWLLDTLDALAGQLSDGLINMTGAFHVPAEQAPALAQVLLAIFQKLIYDQLLIKNDRQLDGSLKSALRPQIQLLLSQIEA
ncbi:hypothetical protein AYR62_14695 [Secundilactobacillus paracollinoides]|uniref:TetR/AcrR family transcriptional regulator n=1 Tax=Secundilactobacillus paracollinoides TaxID=240427 RepID=UPI00081A6619|nr:TetR/AcrR family transcriptional regulator [Secundilactobacillus paracollinoides]ANZ65204.1 hypothetical protein AYR62_14695 [Secundilactobacillus paracollinoides]